MPRFDALTPVHKALRALIYEVGGDLQTTDFADELEAAGAAADLELALHLMRDHHTTEEVYFYPKLQPLEEELVAAMLEQHGNVEQLLDVADLRAVLPHVRLKLHNFGPQVALPRVGGVQHPQLAQVGAGLRPGPEQRAGLVLQGRDRAR